MLRPTKAEIDQILKNAIEAVRKNDVQFVNMRKSINELMELGLSIDESVRLLFPALMEIVSEKYAGKNPPQRSQDKNHSTEAKGLELFVFVWESKVFGLKMYLKISYTKKFLFIYSIHKANH